MERDGCDAGCHGYEPVDFGSVGYRPRELILTSILFVGLSSRMSGTDHLERIPAALYLLVYGFDPSTGEIHGGGRERGDPPSALLPDRRWGFRLLAGWNEQQWLGYGLRYSFLAGSLEERLLGSRGHETKRIE